MTDKSQQTRPELSTDNAEKIRRIAYELNVSQTDALNRILDALTSVESFDIVRLSLNREDKDGVIRKRIQVHRKRYEIKI